ncbi:uncharacterized protein LOC135205461 isoform X2 [Macrobrachium nipponense]|uniref:uncharacterized protein LOC135205461 isoform X2 n=1 Tax=Macrobrachium nipponense TaxID=159736 RepID=UPI0030C7DDAE
MSHGIGSGTAINKSTADKELCWRELEPLCMDTGDTMKFIHSDVMPRRFALLEAFQLMASGRDWSRAKKSICSVRNFP